MFEKEIIALLKKDAGNDITLEVPPSSELGDYAFPCFELAKKKKKSPAQIAGEIAKKLKKPEFIERIEAKGPYVNFFIDNSKLAENVLKEIYSKKNLYGSRDIGKKKNIVIDYSSPNIGKPFHFGHLRSTVIGQSLCLLHKFFGFKVIRINHLGDWGTQFGALIAAHLKWGDKKKLEKEPIKYLLNLYVKFKKEVEKNPELQEEAKEWFRKLEHGNSQAMALWGRFKHLSLDEFRRIYHLMGIEFDSYNGESFYNDKVDKTISAIEKKGITEISDGALVVPMEKDIPPCMLRKSDEASTYASRDLSAIKFRMDSYKPAKILYVVGAEQQLHFTQIFYVAEKMGWNKKNLAHVPFGLYLAPGGKKMATRKGETVMLGDVLNETITKAKKAIEQKNPKLKEKQKIAENVGIGAVIFGDLANDRIKDVVFDWDKILDFEGDTGPYLQYTHARACSIIRKAKEQNLKPDAKVDFSKICTAVEKRLVTLLSGFGSAASTALERHKPHLVAQHLLELARTFNEFYHSCPCLQEKDEKLKNARLLLIDSARQVISNGLSLLGMVALEEM